MIGDDATRTQVTGESVIETECSDERSPLSLLSRGFYFAFAIAAIPLADLWSTGDSNTLPMEPFPLAIGSITSNHLEQSANATRQ
jgi:hypothetical protein